MVGQLANEGDPALTLSVQFFPPDRICQVTVVVALAATTGTVPGFVAVKVTVAGDTVMVNAPDCGMLAASGRGFGAEAVGPTPIAKAAATASAFIPLGGADGERHRGRVGSGSVHGVVRQRPSHRSGIACPGGVSAGPESGDRRRSRRTCGLGARARGTRRVDGASIGQRVSGTGRSTHGRSAPSAKIGGHFCRDGAGAACPGRADLKTKVRVTGEGRAKVRAGGRQTGRAGRNRERGFPPAQQRRAWWCSEPEPRLQRQVAETTIS